MLGCGGDDEVALTEFDAEEIGARCEQLHRDFADDPRAVAGSCKAWAAASHGVLASPAGTSPTFLPDPAGCEAALAGCSTLKAPPLCMVDDGILVITTGCSATVADLEACQQRLIEIAYENEAKTCAELSEHMASRFVTLTMQPIQMTPPEVTNSPCGRVYDCFPPGLMAPRSRGTGP